MFGLREFAFPFNLVIFSYTKDLSVPGSGAGPSELRKMLASVVETAWHKA